MTALQPVPAPGVAILPQYLSPSQIKIILSGNRSVSHTTTATVADSSTPQFVIKAESGFKSLSHRQTVIDAATNAKLFQVRRDGSRLKRYYAEAAESGPRFFQTRTKAQPGNYRPKTTIKFANRAHGSADAEEYAKATGESVIQAEAVHQQVELEFTPAGMGEDGSFVYNGEQVVRVQKLSASIAGEYRLTIAAGVDMALVVGIMVAMIDMAKSKQRTAAFGIGGPL